MGKKVSLRHFLSLAPSCRDPTIVPPVTRGGKLLKVPRKFAGDCGEAPGKAFLCAVGRDKEEENIWEADAQVFSER